MVGDSTPRSPFTLYLATTKWCLRPIYIYMSYCWSLESWRSEALATRGLYVFYFYMYEEHLRHQHTRAQARGATPQSSAAGAGGSQTPQTPHPARPPRPVRRQAARGTGTGTQPSQQTYSRLQCRGSGRPTPESVCVWPTAVRGSRPRTTCPGIFFSFSFLFPLRSQEQERRRRRLRRWCPSFFFARH